VKTVLITGATGVVGSAVAPLFLNEPETEVWLLLRARDDVELAARVDQLFAYWGVDISSPTARARVRAVRGDVSAPLLGLDAASWDRLSRQATHVIHSAASVRLDLPLAEARRSAVEPVKEILRLVERAASGGRLQKLDYVSTIGVAGRLPGQIPETPLESVPGHHNTYEEAKAEAECLVLAAMRAGLPATVHRPSMVVGEARTGKVMRFQVFYFLAEFLSGARTWGVVPRLGDLCLDIVPCDFVAAGIHAASNAEAATGRILHLCAGPGQAIPLAELAGIVRRLRRRRGERLPAVKPVPMPVFRALWRLVQAPDGARWRRQLAKLAPFFSYAAERQVFTTARTTEFLAAHGVVLPDCRALAATALGYQLRTAS
jgi:thioester reductase-like protein